MIDEKNSMEIAQIISLILSDVIYRSYYDLCHKWKLRQDGELLNDGEDIALDFITVDRIVKRCVSDIDKVKVTHSITMPDSHKLAGYLTYELCRHLPVKVLRYDVYNKSSNFFLNQILAIDASLKIINSEKNIRLVKAQMSSGQESDEFLKARRMNNRKVSINDLQYVLKDFLYTLKNCNLNPDLLSLTYFYIDMSATPQK